MPQERVYNETLNNGIPLTLRFRSVKLFRISVKGDGSVEAVAPRALSRAAAMALANGRAEWVRSHREEILSRASRASQYVSGETAPLWGREYALRVETGTPGAELRDDELVLSAPEGADVQSRRAALLSLYRSELERAIPPLVEKYAAAHGVRGLHPGLYNVKMADLLQRYLDSGLAVRVWTVNGADDLRWLMGEGADVITNDPRLALELRRELTDPTEEEISNYLAGNLCRCSGYAGQTRALRAWLHDKPWEKEGQA